MADYIYLLENRLSSAQQQALRSIRNVVRERDLTLFLTGGAVRDLTGGASVRDLDITVQGDVAPLRADLEAAGGIFVGENSPAQALFFIFPGGVRIEIASAVTVTYEKVGQPTYRPANVIDDLRCRDFTANAMALSLNEGSYGLLMDPLNGVADIENREFRLVSNYGFLEDPVRMIRACRLSARLGWHMEERTRQRYDNAREDGAIGALSGFAKGYELEEIFHEEDPLRVMRSLENEGWLKFLAPELSATKANEASLQDLGEKQGQLQTQGILADSASLAFPLLVAKLLPAEVQTIKASFARPGFVEQIDSLEQRTRELQTRFSSKEAATPSVAWRMLHAAEPELVLSMLFSVKGGAVQSRLKTFLNDSPAARQRIPYSLLQEMRITPDLPVYAEVLEKLFFELMDNKLQTTEELKAFLEPYSPPAPPPVNLRRTRAKKEGRTSRSKKKVAEVASEVDPDLPHDADEEQEEQEDPEDLDLNDTSDEALAEDEDDRDEDEEDVNSPAKAEAPSEKRKDAEVRGSAPPPPSKAQQVKVPSNKVAHASTTKGSVPPAAPNPAATAPEPSAKLAAKPASISKKKSQSPQKPVASKEIGRKKGATSPTPQTAAKKTVKPSPTPVLPTARGSKVASASASSKSGKKPALPVIVAKSSAEEAKSKKVAKPAAKSGQAKTVKKPAGKKTVPVPSKKSPAKKAAAPPSRKEARAKIVAVKTSAKKVAPKKALPPAKKR